jgi:hypothetical protein
MNFYYTVDKQTFLDNVHLFCRQLGAHYIDLPDGTILLSANFPQSHYHQDAWESLDGVQALPNPLFAPTQPISDAQQTALTDVLTPTTDAPVQTAQVAPAQLSVATTDSTPAPAPTVLDVATAAAQINPLMKLRSF